MELSDAQIDAIEAKLDSIQQNEDQAAEETAQRIMAEWLAYERSMDKDRRTPVKVEPQQQERSATPENHATRRGPKRHEHTLFIVGLWDQGERNRETIKRKFIKYLPESKKRTKQDEDKLFTRWWANASKHRPAMRALTASQ
jgi:hypothetical protein